MRARALGEQQLASFKVPAKFRIADSLPRAAIEKIAAAELRKLLTANEDAPGGGNSEPIAPARDLTHTKIFWIAIREQTELCTAHRMPRRPLQAYSLER